MAAEMVADSGLDIPDSAYQAVRTLLAEQGGQGDLRLHALAGGKNNQVYKLNMPGRQFLLKIYFRHPDDTRNRLETEFAFQSFAWGHTVNRVSRPIAIDRSASLALYEFVDGRQIGPEDVSEHYVKQALAFFQELNASRHLEGAGSLPLASEACFTLLEHISCVDNRLKRLLTIRPEDADAEHVSRFLGNELWPFWHELRDRTWKQAQSEGLVMSEQVSSGERCLSPSDFGFHNAVLLNDGTLRFIDFEYAGWDDPAKMVCDFFCQPAVPVPLSFLPMFVEAITADSVDPDRLRGRIQMLLPVYRIKWCCILLNDFLPVHNHRRLFAGWTDHHERRRMQLRKVKTYFADNCAGLIASNLK